MSQFQFSGILECLPTSNSLSQSADFMRRYFSTPATKSTDADVTSSRYDSQGLCAGTSGSEMAANDSNRGPDSDELPEILAIVSGTIFTGYASDLESELDESMSDESSEENDENDQHGGKSSGIRAPEFPMSEPPQLKRRRLEIPKQIARHNAKESRLRKLETALTDIEKVIVSKLTQFQAG